MELIFTTGLAPDAEIIKQTFSIFVPHIPIMVNLASKDNLREVKEQNNLPIEAIANARWIKPISRRAPGQRAAHAIFMLRC